MILLIILSIMKPVAIEVNRSYEQIILEKSRGSFILEDFETWPPVTFTLDPPSGNGAWEQSPVNSTWYISPQDAASGDHAGEFDVWSYYAGTTGDMISGQVDLVGASSPELSFYFWNHTDLTGYGNDDSTIVYISDDGGSSWVAILTLSGDIDDWTKYTYDLNSYIGDTVAVKFMGVSDYGGSNMGIDMVELGQRPQFDAGIARVINPQDYTIPSIPFTPSGEIISIGTDTTFNFYVFYTIDSMGTMIYRDSVLVDSLIGGTKDTVDFSSISLSPDFYYNFSFFTILPGDEYPFNDTMNVLTRCYTSQRMVIGELITNTGCSPCKPANDTLDHIFPKYLDSLALVRYHCWWPSSADPFYQYNTTENSARINYYGADYAPHFHIDGDVDGGSARNSWRGLINEEIEKNSPLDVVLSGTYDYGINAGSLYVSIYATGEPVEGNLRLRCSIVENGIQFSAPNGQTVFYQTMRDMFPNPAGVNLGDIHYQEAVACSLFYTVDDSNINEDSVEIVVFVQSDDNKHILQGAKTNLSILSGIGEDNKENALIEVRDLPAIISSYTEFKFSLRTPSSININLYDISGRMIRNILNGSFRAGTHSYGLDPEKLTSGIYFIVLNHKEENIIEKVTIIR